MVYCNLVNLMHDKWINISELSRATGISRNALTKLYYNNTEGIQFKTIDTLCKYFDVPMEKLIIFYKE